MDETEYDVIVIGLGAMGSASLYQLSKRNIKVLGIDRFNPPHDRGSSHGDTRITRLAVGEGAAYVPLVLRSHQIWDELEEASGKKILHKIGHARFSNADGDKPDSKNVIARSANLAKEYGIKHELLTNEQIKTRFPMFDFTKNETGYFEPESGYVLPELAISTQLQLAKENGANILINSEVTSVKADGDTVVVSVGEVDYRAKKVITSAGSWVNDFVPKSHQVFKVERQVLYWFDIKSGYEKFRELPTFFWSYDNGDIDEIYGFPALDGERGGLKVAMEQHSEFTTPDEFSPQVSKEEEHNMFITHVKEQIPALSNKAIKSVACKYTVTPDYGFVIDYHPINKNIIIASPCSGHGFKHSAAIGEVLSQLAIDGQSEIDIEPFSFDRFK